MLKIGLTGYGYLGRRHLKHLMNMENVRVVGVWDSDPTARKAARDDFGVHTTIDYEELIEVSDALDIVTPTSTHFEAATRAINSGLPVFIEKPICATADEGRELVNKAKLSNIPIQVGHIERFNRAFRALKGIEVQPGFIEVHRLAFWNPRGVDVAVVHDLMIHDLDLILSLTNELPVEIHASGVAVVSETVDIANARLKFKSSLVANVTASRISLKQMRKLRMFGSNEYIALDLSKGTCEYFGASVNADELPPNSQAIGEVGVGSNMRVLYQRQPDVEEGDAMFLELQSFRDAVLSGTEPLVTGADGLRALELAELIVDKIGES
ncbi:Gfo/Idh/MocA family oxidoreductase [bacterium]|nr:Gfo/Idh/MocA family oxidoreductase [bacterium]